MCRRRCLCRCPTCAPCAQSQDGSGGGITITRLHGGCSLCTPRYIGWTRLITTMAPSEKQHLRLDAASCLPVALTLARLGVALQITVLAVLVSSGAGAVVTRAEGFGSPGPASLLARVRPGGRCFSGMVVPNSGPSRGTNAKDLLHPAALFAVTAVTRSGDSGMDRVMVHCPPGYSALVVHLCTCAPVASPAARNKCGADRAHTLHRCTAASQCPAEHRSGRAMPMHGKWEVGRGERWMVWEPSKGPRGFYGFITDALQ
jgi:hypothetical protein